MDNNENIIPQIIYLRISNINYNNAFDNLGFEFKDHVLLFKGLQYRIF